MPPSEPMQTYKRVIDRLVHACRIGQGQIGPRRVRDGVWNRNADDLGLSDQQEMNRLLERMSIGDGEVVAQMLERAFESGVHETLVVLHETPVEPFDKGFEGSPFHDFIGRLSGWEWPAGDTRS